MPARESVVASNDLADDMLREARHEGGNTLHLTGTGAELRRLLPRHAAAHATRTNTVVVSKRVILWLVLPLLVLSYDVGRLALLEYMVSAERLGEALDTVLAVLLAELHGAAGGDTGGDEGEVDGED